MIFFRHLLCLKPINPKSGNILDADNLLLQVIEDNAFKFLIHIELHFISASYEVKANYLSNCINDLKVTLKLS